MIIAATLFIRYKKRSADRRRRQREDRLLAHHFSLSTGYYLDPEAAASKPHTPEYPLEISSSSQHQQQEPFSCLDSPQQRVIEDPPPAYQPLPAYNPSRYQGVDGMVGIAVPYPGVTASMYMSQRRAPERDSNAFSFAVEERLDVAVPREVGEEVQQEEEVTSLPRVDGQVPQRPRPVLSRMMGGYGCSKDIVVRSTAIAATISSKFPQRAWDDANW
ncbi:uncharacterized protein BO80DRAFT_431098 [Aspergillus ibericus CBS 121593]|uniref:Uncharacterized protein n=1 Tax=Aspergillus ibericus CBS 121593 TaxID=1448316 RepID=A0A395HDL8_9EURO|nr:hypothetical protein BO80DRAFT_431098 [Aspergillus ibericus CBS 121593]RAL05967.1 hypothetical protein BO80DRAFT_431098 [Aspergillus ibericus CBS 121593]